MPRVIHPYALIARKFARADRRLPLGSAQAQRFFQRRRRLPRNVFAGRKTCRESVSAAICASFLRPRRCFSIFVIRVNVCERVSPIIMRIALDSSIVMRVFSVRRFAVFAPIFDGVRISQCRNDFESNSRAFSDFPDRR